MRYFSFFSPRKGIARWAVGCFEMTRKAVPGISDEEIIQLALNTRYKAVPLRKNQAAVLEANRHWLKNIRDLCFLVAHVEFGEDSAVSDSPRSTKYQRTCEIIDKELKRLGY